MRRSRGLRGGSEAHEGENSTHSENLGNFRGEVAIHFIGVKNLDVPIVWVFSEIVVCLNWSPAQFAIAEGELCFKRATPLLEHDNVRGGKPYRILVVDDFEGFRRFVNSALRRRTGFQVVEASDGLAAVQKAEELKPDLILLDIGLPSLNGLEVARRIREFDPSARILFLSQESSADVIQEALGLGTTGYVHKPSAQRDLLPAIEAVLKGKQFVSNGLEFRERRNPPHRHEIIFCSDDEMLLNGLVRFVAAALHAGDAAIVWATEPHRADIRQRLSGQGVDVDSALQRGTYISSDVSEPPDPQRILASIKGLSDAAFRMGRRHPRVSVCGERAGRLWAEGKTDTALRIEKLFNELAKTHDIDILCVYPLPQRHEEDAFKSLCAEHTTVCYR